MAEHTEHPGEQVPEHDPLSEQLAALSSETAHRSQLPPAADIRRRASRRRTGQVAIVAAATATVLAVAWSVAAPGADNAVGPQPAGPVTTKTSGLETSVPTTSDATSADPTPDVSPSTAQEYHPVVAPLVTVSSPGPTPAGGWVTTIPAGLELPFEGAKNHSVEASDWTELDGVDGWLLLPCDAAERTG